MFLKEKLMKIVILDAEITNPGDISWDEIGALGEMVIYDYTPKELVVERSKDADAILVTRVFMTEDLIRQLPNLKYIGVFATGFNMVDVKVAAEQGITVCNVPHYCSKTVAQMVFAHLMELCIHVDVHTDYVKSNRWQESLDYERKVAPFLELTGKTMGIIGYGSIGIAVAEIAKAMGMNVIAYSKSPKEIETVSLETLLKESDVVSVHCALNDETRGMINLERMKTMKPTAFIINTSRGAVVNEAELAQALNEGIIAGAGVDVMSEEPPNEHFPLLTAKNCYITPHIAWASRESRKRLVTQVAKNIECFQKGETQNKVN